MGISISKKKLPSALDIQIDMAHQDIVVLQTRINNYDALLENPLIQSDPEASKVILQRKNKWLRDQIRLINELVMMERNRTPVN